jgi:hypothetical protein
VLRAAICAGPLASGTRWSRTCAVAANPWSLAAQAAAPAGSADGYGRAAATAYIVSDIVKRP